MTSKIKGFTEFNEARPYPERRPMSDSLRRAQANMKKLASGEVKKTTEKAKTWAQHKKDMKRESITHHKERIKYHDERYKHHKKEHKELMSAHGHLYTKYNSSKPMSAEDRGALEEVDPHVDHHLEKMHHHMVKADDHRMALRQERSND